MKLVSFLREGSSSVGAVEGDRILDLGADPSGRRRGMRDLLRDPAQTLRLVEAGGPTLALTAVRLLPPVPDPDKILCVGVNYDEHRKETGRAESEHPVLFTRFANTLVPDGAPLLRPPVSEQFDFEGELAVVIGRSAHRVSAAEALEYVGGYACFVDATLRDWQRHTHQFTPGKNFLGTGGFGPWLVTTDELPDPQALSLTTRLNGAVVQSSGTDVMIFGVAELIEYISTFTELVPGDVIATGTPSGVGHARKPPLYMRPGDTLEVEISGVGTLSHPIRDAAYS